MIKLLAAVGLATALSCAGAALAAPTTQSLNPQPLPPLQHPPGQDDQLDVGSREGGGGVGKAQIPPGPCGAGKVQKTVCEVRPRPPQPSVEVCKQVCVAT